MVTLCQTSFSCVSYSTAYNPLLLSSELILNIFFELYVTWLLKFCFDFQTNARKQHFRKEFPREKELGPLSKLRKQVRRSERNASFAEQKIKFESYFRIPK